MKRFLLFLTCMLMLFGVGKAETKIISFSGIGASGNGVVAPERTEGIFKLTFDKGGASNAPTYYATDLRMYGKSGNGNAITISCQEGYKMTGMVFTSPEAKYTFSDGSQSVGSLSVSGTTNTWSAGSNNVTSVTFTNKRDGTDQVRLSNVVITYVEIDPSNPSTKVEYEAPFNGKTYTIAVGETLNIDRGKSYPSSMIFILGENSILEEDEDNFTLTGISAGTEKVDVMWEGDGSFEEGEASFTVTVTDKNSGGSDNEKRVWKLINDPKDVTADGQYIIAHKNGNKYYAMNTGVTSGNKITTDEVTVTDDILTPATSTAIFILEADTDGKWKLKCPSNENKYLHSSGSTNLNFNSSTSFSNTIAFENNNVKIENDTRRVFANNDNNYGNYAINNNWNGSSYYKPSLYKYVISSSLQDVELSFDSEHVYGNKVLGGLIEPKLTVKPEAANKYVEFSSSDTAVATINRETGKVSMLKAGTTTIYAKIKDNEEYNYAEASYVLTVTDKNSGETPTIESSCWEKVTSKSDLTFDGEYIIAAVGTYGSKNPVNYSDAMILPVGSNAYMSGAPVVVEGNTITISDSENSNLRDNIAVIKFEGDDFNSVKLLFSKLDGTVKGYYNTTVEKAMSFSATGGTNASVSFSEVGGPTISFGNSLGNLYYNYNSGNSRFVNYKNAQQSYDLYKKVGPKLGEVEYTVTDGKLIDDEEKLTVNLNDIITFKAENATDITVTVNEESANGKFEKDVYTWTIDKFYDNAIVEVTPMQGEKKGESLSFKLYVMMPTPGKPVVKANGVILEGEKVTVAPNTEIEITCENAIYIEGYVGEDNDVNKENGILPYKYTVKEETNIHIQGYNENDVPGEELDMTLIIGEVDPNAPAVGSNFKQVLNANKDKELVKDAYYVIGRHYNDLQVAMSKNFNNGNFSKSDNVSYEAVNERYRDEANQRYQERSFDVLTMTGDDVLILKLDQNDEGQWGLKTVNYGDGLDASQKYLTNSTEEGASVTALALSDDFAAVNIEYPEKSNNVRIIFPGTTGRILTYNTNSGTFNNQQTTSANVQLYKYSTAKVFHHPYKDTQILLKAGESHTIELEGDDHPEVNYSVKQNTKCVTIEEGSNVIKTDEIREADEATIVARWDESEDWFPNIIEFTVVFRYPAELGFRYAEVRGKKDVGVAAQAAYYTGDGTLTYYIEKEVDGEWVDASDEIAINSETGMIRPDDLVNPVIDEPYRVRVHVTDDKASYIEKDAYYTLKIEAPEGGSGEAVSGQAMFDFTDASNPYRFFMFDSNSTATSNKYFSYYEGNIDKYTGNVSENEEDPTTHVPVSQISKDGVTLSFTGEYRWMNKNHLRLYGPNSFIKISAGDGKVKSVSLKVNSGNYFNKNFRVEGEGSGAYDSTTDLYTWTATSDEGVDYVTFEAQTKPEIYTIEVKSLQPSYPDGKQPVNLAFDVTAADVDRHISFFEDQVIPLPPLTYNTNGGTINFSEAVENGDLVLSFDPIKPASEDTPAEEVKGRYYANNFNDIKVELDEPGVYTFRAEYKGEDFLQGMAILRLNVFPRLTVTTENEDLLSDHELGEDHEITLIHYNEGSNDNSTTVKIPSLDELLKGEDGYRYSTIEVTEVEVKHGGKTEIYTKEVGEGIPATYDFSTDGYVKYTIVYGGEDDFKVESIVNVIFMPHFVDDTNTAGELEITPVVNTTVLYRTYSTPGSNNDKEEVKARRLVDNEGLEWAELTERTKFSYDDAVANGKVKNGDVFVVVAKPTKDISNLVASEKNGLLEGDITEYYLTASGNTTTGIEDVELSEDAEVEYFNLQGVKIKNPEKGGIYIKVTGKKAEKVIL